ncbi:MAG TPA: hypothetical protein VJI75_04385 [Candidatus Nanoarchaeia archaeon]|nr:hypothetical protein [Candidatus Nanoarchaeia archaeon]
MLFSRTKKGDLNLSVQSIVILIFAIIMLGLGLTLINFIFKSGKEKLGAALAVTDLTVKPTADDPLTVPKNVQLPFEGEQELQIGFYNKLPNTRKFIFPFIVSCKNSQGSPVKPYALPFISAESVEGVGGSGSTGWQAILRYITPTTEDDRMVAGKYICKVNIYGADALATAELTPIDFSTVDDPTIATSTLSDPDGEYSPNMLASDQFYLEIIA